MSKFTEPARISPFYDYNIKLPRKLKKKMKAACFPAWDNSTNGQRLWHYLGIRNVEYRDWLIMKIVR